MSHTLIEVQNTKDEKRKKRLEAYARFLSIIEKQGMSPYKVAKNTGIATATLSDWKNGISMPKKDKIDAISEFIGGDSDFIMYGKKNNFSENDALLDARISEDAELKEAIKKYYTLDEKARKYILEGIDLLWRANKTDTK